MEIGEAHAADLRLFLEPHPHKGQNAVVVGVPGFLGFAREPGGPGVMHGGREQDGLCAGRGNPVEQRGHVGLVGVEHLLLERVIAAIVHAEQDRDVFGFVGGHILLKPVQGVLGAVSTHAGIVEMHPLGGVARKKVVLHVLGVETLMGDGVAEKNKVVSVLNLDAVRDLFELRCRSLRGLLRGSGLKHGRTGQEQGEERMLHGENNRGGGAFVAEKGGGPGADVQGEAVLATPVRGWFNGGQHAIPP